MGIDFTRTRGIIFDLDGTLYAMDWRLRPVLALLTFPHCRRLPRFIRARGRLAGKDFGSNNALLDAMADALSRSENIGPAEARAWITQRFYPAFIRTMPLFRNSRRGVNALLAALRNRGTRLAVLSDYDAVEQRLDGLSIDRGEFDSIASSELYGALKPCERPMLDIARQWAMAPERIIVIGDRDDTDGEAARRAGMGFMRVSGGRRKGGTPWADVVSHLEKVGTS